VIDLEPQNGNSVTPPGSITLILSRAGSGVLEQVQSAVLRGGQDLVDMAERLVTQYANREPIELGRAAKVMIQQPVFAEIRYGGETFAQGLFVPEELLAVVLILPYNGGRLAAEGFTLAERFTEASTERLEGLLLRTLPPLTAAERAVLDQVPDDQLINNVGRPRCDTTYWAVAATVAVAVTIVLPPVHITAEVLAATLTAAEAGGAIAVETNIPEADLRTLGPAASARRLLELRRQKLFPPAPPVTRR
jgi:hypothetical protein